MGVFDVLRGGGFWGRYGVYRVSRPVGCKHSSNHRVIEFGKLCEVFDKGLLAEVYRYIAIVLQEGGEVNTQEVADASIKICCDFFTEAFFKKVFYFR